ncbi:MAG: hypothetical protein KIT60_31115 [Burkholderiaceae bacterium]|nr:hypothetical protein [Burkholderiaceae bacterium]
MRNEHPPAVWLRAAVALALVLTWLVPAARLAELPQQRALALAATEPMCLSSRAALVSSLSSIDGGVSRRLARPTLADVAAPMQRAFEREWRTDLTRVLFVALAAGVLLVGAHRTGGVAALLVIAAATLYLWVHEAHWDGYRLLWVAQSLPLWWHAVSQWGWALAAERLVAPVTVWLALLGGGWLLLRAEGVRPRRAPPPAPALDLS